MASRRLNATVIDGRTVNGVVTVTTAGRSDVWRRNAAHGWPPQVQQWRHEVAHRLGSCAEPLHAIPVIAWTAASAPLIVGAACALWIAARPSRCLVTATVIAVTSILGAMT